MTSRLCKPLLLTSKTLPEWFGDPFVFVPLSCWRSINALNSINTHTFQTCWLWVCCNMKARRLKRLSLLWGLSPSLSRGINWGLANWRRTGRHWKFLSEVVLASKGSFASLGHSVMQWWIGDLFCHNLWRANHALQHLRLWPTEDLEAS